MDRELFYDIIDWVRAYSVIPVVWVLYLKGIIF